MTPRRVLICRVGAMGDVLHALPAVAALRRQRPDWRIGWAVDPRWAPLLADGEGNGIAVQRVHLVETKLWSKSPLSMATLRSIRGLRSDVLAENYDLAVDMQGTLRSAVIARLSGAPSRAGYSDPRESLATSFYTQRLQRTAAHVVDQGVGLLSEACGVELDPGAVPLPHEPWADHWAADLIAELPPGHRVCVLAPGAGWGAKRWPPERFGALAQQLQMMGFTVMVNAPRKDDPLAAKVVAASASAARIVVCNVTGIIALLRRTSLLVGGDSGPLHLAAALAVPLVALFGPTNPARNGPWGPGPKIVLRDPASVTSYKRRDEVDPGLANLNVEAVLNAVSQLI
jgi:heptosyltransferase-1